MHKGADGQQCAAPFLLPFIKTSAHWVPCHVRLFVPHLDEPHKTKQKDQQAMVKQRLSKSDGFRVKNGSRSVITAAVKIGSERAKGAHRF
jgi:hypothetical protein